MTIDNDLNQNDSLERFVFENCDIRGAIIRLNKSYQDALAHQTFSSRKKLLLGEFFAAVGLLGDSLKFKGILTLQARGDGVVPLVMADINSAGEFRGIVKKKDETLLLETDDLPNLLGSAVLSITIDPDKGERYQGIVPLLESKLAQCLSDYFSQSEQLPSWFSLFSSEEFCGGLFLQALPKKVILDHEETQENWNTAIQLASTLKAEELFSLNYEEILYRLFHELGCKVFPPKPLRFACSCNEDRSSNAIIALGEDEAYALLEERGVIDINCEFCGRKYVFNESALKTLFTSH